MSLYPANDPDGRKADDDYDSMIEDRIMTAAEIAKRGERRIAQRERRSAAWTELVRVNNANATLNAERDALMRTVLRLLDENRDLRARLAAYAADYELRGPSSSQAPHGAAQGAGDGGSHQVERGVL